MKAVLILTTLLCLIGCKSDLKFKGSMVVDNEIVLTSEGSTIEVKEGIYTSEIKLKGKKKLRLKITEDDKTHKLYINTKKEIRAQGNGHFEILANASSLNFDMVGSMNESSSLGKTTNDYEPCQYQEPVTICHPAPGGGVTCSTQWESRSGLRDVEFQDKRIVTRLDVSLLKPQSKTKMASYNGKNVTLKRIYSYEGICR